MMSALFVFCRLAELREVLVDLRSKHEIEIGERRNLESNLSQRYFTNSFDFDKFNITCLN